VSDLPPCAAPKAVRHKPKGAHVWSRDDYDWYVEPRQAALSLFETEDFEGGVYDPACGGGNIVRAALECGLIAYGSDIVNRAGSPSWFVAELDFLSCGDPKSPFYERYSNIVTNPPFYRAKGTEDFIRKALSLATRKVAVFASLPFLASGKRARGLFLEHPPTRIWVLGDRPSCPPGEYLAAGNKASGGTEDWCWIIYDKTEPFTGTKLGWLTRSKI